MNEIDPKALFRLSVLGPLVSRERLERGELQQIILKISVGLDQGGKNSGRLWFSRNWEDSPDG